MYVKLPFQVTFFSLNSVLKYRLLKYQCVQRGTFNKHTHVKKKLKRVKKKLKREEEFENFQESETRTKINVWYRHQR